MGEQASHPSQLCNQLAGAERSRNLRADLAHSQDCHGTRQDFRMRIDRNPKPPPRAAQLNGDGG
ncbi:hypothetical protein KWAN_290 [Erwinia phage vB_EamM_Kwan]|uniref:Uncharacterized protein n=1 Tax=Erwinia phage vB_EamM_Kwan TaxID=1883374 RepID=A0A1B2IEE1_9CAUD|nr:hypothetical protein BIZ80_gp009 [Erwinia phage vB_EamM_Kwan]ANZ49641.1 hypothetical protein KWAN_290 [Erwinia phage vB_EamM_Kwan]